MMKVSPRSSLSLEYTPKQWVCLCNTFLLLFVTIMFGLVIFNMNSRDQRIISILDSSPVVVDLVAMDILLSQTSSHWRTINKDISVYSAFHHQGTTGNSVVVIIGSSPRNDIRTDDLRCLIDYDEEDDINIEPVDYQKISNCSSTILLHCHAKSGAVAKKVALVSYSNKFPKQWIEVKTLGTGVNGIGPPKIAACIRPFTGEESVDEIAEFIAFYETIGVSYFYFYNHNAAQDVVDFTRQLKDIGHSVNLLPWNKNDIFSSGCPIFLSEHVQDCLHRASDKYLHVLTVGVLDFAVPTQYFGLPALLESANKNDSQLRLNFANFCEMRNSHSRSDDGIAIKSMTVRGGIQQSNSNYILRSEESLRLNGQFTNITQPIETLNANEVLVHHHSKNCESVNTVDLSAYKYRKLVDQSKVLEYKRTSRGDLNRITFPAT